MSKNKTSLPLNKVTLNLISKILKYYFRDFRLSSFQLIKKGYENVSIIVKPNQNKYVIRIYNRYQFSEHKRIKESILWELDFIEYVGKKGTPVPKIIHTLDNQQLLEIKIGQHRYFVILTEYIRGHHLKKLNTQQLKQIINYQALMHKYLKGFKTQHSRGQIDQFGFEKWVLKYHKQKINQAGKHQQLLVDLKNIVELLYPKLLKLAKSYKKIPIHNDLNRENFKFLNGKISGIFDFDDALMGVPLIELGKTIFFISKKTVEPKKLNMQIDKFLDYYSKINKLTQKDRHLVKLAFMLSWTAHKFFFFDNKPLAIKTPKDCLRYYNFYYK